MPTDVELLDRLDQRLATLVFPEASIAVYQLVVRDVGTWTWEPSTGFVAGSARKPTFRLELERQALDELLDGRKRCDDLLQEKRLQVGGLHADWEAFLSLWIEEQPRKLIEKDRLNLPTKRSRLRLMAEAERVLRDITTDDAALVRIRRMLAAWANHEVDTIQPNETQLIPFPGLPSSGWVRDDIAPQLDRIVTANFAGLRAEAEKFLTGAVKAPLYGHVEAKATEEIVIYNTPKGWRSKFMLNLYRKKPPSVLAEFPVTSKVIDQMLEVTQLVHVAFLLMEPDNHLAYHADGASLFVHHYLGLIVPEGCYFDSNGDRRELQEGRSLVFADSVVHAAGNSGNSMRVVLASLYFNQQLTPIEQLCLVRLQDVLPRGSIIFSGEYV